MREARYASELPMGESAVRNAQSAHVTVLRRSDMEETLRPPAEIIGGLWIFVLRGLAAKMKASKVCSSRFQFSWSASFLAAFCRCVLSQEVRRIGAYWF
jgi:hypothetical protein